MTYREDLRVDFGPQKVEMPTTPVFMGIVGMSQPAK